MSIKNIRLEVMQFLENKVDSFVDDYLIPVEKIWQPSDFLPNSESDNFLEEVKAIKVFPSSADVLTGVNNREQFGEALKRIQLKNN